MNYKISAVEFYLPGKVISNEFLSETAGIDPKFLEEKVGIKNRHIAGDDETTSDMAVKAANILFENYNIKPEEIDLLLVCTQNPDYRLPTTACIVQSRLGLKTSCIAFDINLGCSGFIYSMIIAGNFIKTGMIRSALLIMADEYSKIIDYKDKNTASIFGDAASSVLLESCNEYSGMIDSVFGSDGSNFDKLIAYNSGIKKEPEKSSAIFMDGREIFKFSIQVVPESVRDILLKNDLGVSDIRYFIFHQANKYMLSEIQKILYLTDEQMVIDMENYGNTISSSIPIAYKNIIKRGKLKNGDKIIFCGFGVGLSWGTILYNYTD